ncbi:phospho-sugar mutase [Hanamia caeni]|jgi:phosphoglucomutase|uniref:Phospho-sugar mutase n=1 Tax=Hanamia caeni TaxID=2294116 RepID=A0A3M9NFK6_9BACT|nr:phospho-sugar mutase [Hanamia caeni]RNI36572.1 phospho-sugar mutase [Hanamia caeni]
MDTKTENRIKEWLSGDYDEIAKEKIRELQKNDPAKLEDAFYKDLEFGTGGLRGIMGVGTNRMNKFTVGMATQGYANYLKQSFPEVKVAIAHDVRNSSRKFAEIAADIFAANGIKVYLFESIRPTPELSFAIRRLQCQGGLVITASHNPKEYNGYKAYWKDGGQLVPPHDKNVITEVEKIKSIDDVKWKGHSENITLIGKEMDDAYLEMVKNLSINPDACIKEHDLKIVYTPIHGTGIMLVPKALAAYGFDNVHIVEEQATPDGTFPTVVYPNPEEKETMSIGLKKAKELDADILLGTDPDADRVGVGVKDNHGNWVLLNGNQTALIVFNYIIEARKLSGKAEPNDMIVKTIVTTDMIDKIAEKNNITCYNVLTGFKWIAELIREKEGEENYIVGGEESFGLMIGDKVRDKDAVSAVAMICEIAAVEKQKGRTLFEKLMELYVKYGFYFEKLISITKTGMNGSKEIAEMMQSYRDNPPKEIAGSPVKEVLDYQLQVKKDLLSGDTQKIELPKSNVLQFITEDGSKISARPSGTEPKIKFYFSVNSPLSVISEFDATQGKLEQKIDAIISSMQLK